MREDSGEFNVPATFVYVDRLLISDAGKQVLSGEAEKESFDKFVPIWIENASIGSACELVRFGFAKKEEMEILCACGWGGWKNTLKFSFSIVRHQ